MIIIMRRYFLEGETYVMEDYDKLPAFSSFLPGLAGIRGIPVWVYYTNRGQGINSFGVHNKSNAIMEFNPANTAYENTAVKGFRTFIRCNGVFYEPFFPSLLKTERTMYMNKNSFKIQETNADYGLRITITYYVLPEEPVGGLVRKVELENISEEEKDIELLDGLPKIIPYGIKNGDFKEMSNLLKSWTEIKHRDTIPYYTLRATSDDSAKVDEIEGGYYYLTVKEGSILPVIYDGEVIFGQETSLLYPVCFLEEGLAGVLKQEQCYANKIPCGFTPVKTSLKPGEICRFSTLTGYSRTPEQIIKNSIHFCIDGYFDEKEQRAEEIVKELTQDVDTHTAVSVFDQYVKQCYLDNFLRGGYPYIFKEGDTKAVIHLFSRKHGDPERDYNFFSIAGEYYSQGNGNFRDVCQNRRNDVFFHKDMDSFNIKTFYNLLQIDGYNPLEVRPSTFQIREETREAAEEFITSNVIQGIDKMKAFLEQPFTPGQAAAYLADKQVRLGVSDDEFIAKLITFCNQNIEAGFGEGYWSDHWNYTLDLIEDYQKIYPDKMIALLFQDNTYRFYDSGAYVLPRSEKYVIYKEQVRQYGAVIHGEEKFNTPDFNKNGTNWLKDEKGNIIETTLMVKLVTLALVKFTTLDPEGMGIEMEGGKPGWNDAMNGLPGLIGSGMPETFELKRLLIFIRTWIQKESSLPLPLEIHEFLIKTMEALESLEEFAYWDKMTSLREEFREKVRFRLKGETCIADTSLLSAVFNRFLNKVQMGIDKACTYGKGIVPTYFTYEAVEFSSVLNHKKEPVLGYNGFVKAKVKAFRLKVLPVFLEGPAKLLAGLEDKDLARELHYKVKTSDLYDKKLKMYKTSVSLENISMENGRIRAFTPGWLERESIFLHMEYKYLLALLKAGLYKEYFEEIKTTLIPFLPPMQYGRSILENSSFIASSANPDTKVHGRGYVARLSGSTTELLSMWIELFAGNQIFTLENGELVLHLKPRLPDWMFDERGEVSFILFSGCKVTYQNKGRKATFGADKAVIKRILLPEGECVRGKVLTGERALKVRDGRIRELMVILE
ncbi:hypothetical protein acsn021_36540 [Anaerocolumna cellulosilytica]|uniref:Uncharacterized protein n=1 Tax=Anaerocolumna cellulosilytica TaxID=433286 RepID=A0A6S6RAF9_9FIRM|nr:cellobiose phosphorylase [Anaerocolumna cellulosilytica]MBB5195077.1 hypothetical protein [Anaerocolumna cellulosilytica]BCJ96085.1 hypothetical protein acsn021_36540 [Anaerocolumna cellulosilytica]